MNRQEINDRIKALGAARVGADYDQSRANSHSGVHSQSQAGFCNGATVDWVRRVLTGGKSPVEGNPFPVHTAFPDKMGRQYVKGIGLQPFLTAQARDDFYNRYNVAVNQLHDNKQAAVSEAIDKAQFKFNTQEDYDAYVKKVMAAWEYWRKTEYKELSSIDVKFKKFWQTFLQSRAAQVGRHGAHQLAELAVVHASTSQIYDSGLRGLILAALKAVRDYQAVVVGVSPPVEKSAGHAIAIWRLDKDKYYFFDPNYGVYLGMVRPMYEVFMFLFKTAYPSGSSRIDDHTFEIDGKVYGDFVVLEKKKAA